MNIDLRWQKLIDTEVQKEYMVKLKEFVNGRRKVVNVLPPANKVFEAFNIVNWDLLKVIIIGNEPYCKREDCDGLAFSSPSQQTPYPLKNIFDEIFQDIYGGNTGGQKIHYTNSLTQWAEQGVLLLNSCLTVEENEPNSHQNKGWEMFIENTVKHISENHHFKLVFILLGKQAKQYTKYIDTGKHLVLESEHPGAAKHNPNAWFGCKVFSQANNFIAKHYFNIRGTINWGTWITKTK